MLNQNSPLTEMAELLRDDMILSLKLGQHITER